MCTIIGWPLDLDTGHRGKMKEKEFIKRIPVLGRLIRYAVGKTRAKSDDASPFPGSAEYWRQRYLAGGNSGPGSFGKFAEFKAQVLNSFVEKQQIQSVIEFGCGDGNQLRIALYPKYLGFDVSADAVGICRNLFQSDPTKSFRLVGEYAGDRAELTLSLDVVYHLVEDAAFEQYMRTLFGAAERYVIVYSSDFSKEQGDGSHVKHRNFTKWVAEMLPEWKLEKHIPNKYPYGGDYMEGSFADFFVFGKG